MILKQIRLPIFHYRSISRLQMLLYLLGDLQRGILYRRRQLSDQIWHTFFGKKEAASALATTRRCRTYMTKANQKAIFNPAKGLMVYVVDG